MTEYQIFNLMHVGFIQNAMYFVGMVLFTWLGFRMANNIYNNPESNMLAKVFTSLFCVLVAAMMFNVQQIGAAILGTAVTQLADIGAASAERMQMYVDSPLGIGGAVQTMFVLLVVVFQLAIVWTKK
ncbi:MAG: hypothetical protein CMD75_02000 [Gammaproteobacteria bacterium]|nr:hypothetical protein [Gammaproteobacteria bacterium]|tara:strand:+ start:612 stop:992 length:381 start_codon:yes stop_codon:yes gene_type:complete